MPLCVLIYKCVFMHKIFKTVTSNLFLFSLIVLHLSISEQFIYPLNNQCVVFSPMEKIICHTSNSTFWIIVGYSTAGEKHWLDATALFGVIFLHNYCVPQECPMGWRTFKTVHRNEVEEDWKGKCKITRKEKCRMTWFSQQHACDASMKTQVWSPVPQKRLSEAGSLWEQARCAGYHTVHQGCSN